MNKIEAYIAAHKKSYFVSVLLALFFGPLGLFYSSWVAALILCVVTFITLWTYIIPMGCWLISAVLAVYFVYKHNEKVKVTAAIISVD